MGAAGTGVAGTGAAGMGAAGAAGGVPPGLRNCTEFDHNAANNACNTTTGVGDWTVRSVAFSPDGKTFVSAAGDWRIKVWNVDKGNITDAGFAFTAGMRQPYVAFLPDGSGLVSGSRAAAGIWDTKTWSQRSILGGVTGDIYAIAVTPDGKFVVSADDGKKLYIHTVAAPSTPTTATLASIPYAVAVTSAPSGGYWLAVGMSNGSVTLYDLSSSGVIGPTPRTWVASASTPVNAVAFAPGGRTLVTGDDESFIRFWDVAATGTPTSSSAPIQVDLQGIKSVVSLQFNASGAYLLVAAASLSAGGSVSIWSTTSHTMTGFQYVPTWVPMSVAFSPSGTTVGLGEYSCGKVAICADP